MVRTLRTTLLRNTEKEPSIHATRTRLHSQALEIWIKQHILEKSHPFWKVRKQINSNNNKRLISPRQKFAILYDTATTGSLEAIKPSSIPPWQERLAIYVEEKDDAIEYAKSRTWATVQMLQPETTKLQQPQSLNSQRLLSMWGHAYTPMLGLVK